MADEPIVLDPNEPQKVTYCIPLWLRDEHIKLAIARGLPRVEPHDLRDEPIALVSFGPSLNDTWEKIRDFKYVMTCSGSHKFLIERGIIPTWHVEVDPRPHKVTLLGTPHPDVEYLIASACHPEYFDHLQKASAKVKLWHVFDSADDARRTIPCGDWALTGGCSVGLRTMTMARFLGFKDQHIFGMDGCQRDDTHKHASAHPIQDGSKYVYTDYEGVRYKTTPGMLEAARGTFHELDTMRDVKATFYGEGLVQAMAKKYVPKEEPPKQVVIGVSKPELISASYRDLNAQLHKENLAYGVGGGKYAQLVRALMDTMKNPTVLDYGCGKGYLAKELAVPIWEYDPAVPGKDESPRAADIVVCTDVLEHIEPDKLLYVLDDLRRVVKRVGFFSIHTGAAQKTLPDGRNTHLIQKDWEWWKPVLEKFFSIGKKWDVGQELLVLVGPRKAAKKEAA